MNPTLIARNLEQVQARIAAACQRAGRPVDAVTLVAVSKTFPVEVVEAARKAGLHNFGENRVQELVSKADRLPGMVAGGTVCWHLIGHLQRNKAKDAVRVADVFHALDSFRLAEELDRRCAEAGRVLPCFGQVNVSEEDSKSGIAPDETHAFLDQVATLPHLRLLGLMTLAAPTDDPEAVRPQFRLLRTLRDTWQEGRLPYLSMGMSGDFEVAIEEGATHVRVGSALFGSRS